eukprot:CAMPEP_0119109694 /NCGR_PEP_ID=MMETSP1180-20130426/22413_1 /TAXON_ID=3052 ORGANISM="Chlamydomonas cf sp, Strain CCMP681" /NCGR_SAMPLE_ID=MMETSP1180 /ASSEMBLY_ACC=CAM_ASM_000741 /LENGTH=75 /DNA_ID=CAMNT_0007095603 /DNA_START=337 /DNA_END=564 /DNA_ORIENTATION=-
MVGRRLRVTRNTPLNTIPNTSSGKNVWSRKWHMAKRREVAAPAQWAGMYRAKLASRKPLKMASSQMGAQMDTTLK